jgi:hypothetical protein
MVKRRTVSNALTKAEQRIIGYRAINPQMDFSNGLDLVNYQTSIDRTRQNMEAYNTALIAVEAAQQKLHNEEKQLAYLNEHLFLSVAAHYGKDSLEYKQSGGIRKSDRKRPKRKETAKMANEAVKDVEVAVENESEMAIAVPANS